MKKIIYFMFILVALASCEKAGAEIDLLNTIWDNEEVITDIDEGVSFTNVKSILFISQTAGQFAEIHMGIRYILGFTYEINGKNIYIETEKPKLSSFTGKIEGNTMTLKGIDGEKIYKKR